MTDALEKRVLMTIWPKECKGLGEESINFLIAHSISDSKVVKIVGGEDFELASIYRLLREGLRAIREVRKDVEKSVAMGETNFKYKDKERELEIKTRSPQVAAVVPEIARILAEALTEERASGRARKI